MNFERIDRVLLLVSDFDKARAFFADLFDLEYGYIIEDKETQIRIVHDAADFGLELASPMNDSTPLAAMDSEFLKKTGGGIRTVVIKVGNLEAALERFKARGIEPTACMIHGRHKEAFFDPKDTFGLPICLNEYPHFHPAATLGIEYLRTHGDGKVKITKAE